MNILKKQNFKFKNGNNIDNQEKQENVTAKEDNVQVIHYIQTERICSDSIRTAEQQQGYIKLLDSIKKYGLIHPIIVKRISVEASVDKGLFSLISGYRRLCAYRTLGIDRIPAIIYDKSDDIQNLQFVLNETSEKYTLFQKCDIITSILNSNQNEVDDVLNNLCITKKELADLLLISSIPENQREMCIHYNLSDKQIQYLSRIKDSNQRRFAIRHIGSNNFSLRQTAEYIYDMFAIDCMADKDLPTQNKMILKDIRLFYNTIDKAMDTFSQSGIRTDCFKKEGSEGFTITIKIYKSTNKQD